MSSILNFLDLEADYCDPESARVWIIPAPLEATVSYGRGTGNGPLAIINASHQVELYDREFMSEPAHEYGIYTLPMLSLQSQEKALGIILDAVRAAVSKGKLPVVLGGEHTVTVGGIRGLLKIEEGPISIVHIDAHCDLRDSFEGTGFSHACVARRLLELPGVEQIIQLGIRSICREEADFLINNPERVIVFDNEKIHAGGWQFDFAERIKDKRVFISIDVDGLDPSVIPATGTPEPNGLSWAETMEILKIASKSATVVGLDCVELAPAEPLHMADFAAAKLVYKAISYALRVCHSCN
jgi:agmatinase